MSLDSRSNKVEFLFEGQKIVFEKGFIAKQADQSIVVRWNDNVVLLTLCVSNQPTSSNFLPLTVEFQDNLFSVSKIPGGFFRREGKPSEYSTLSARIVDRAIRPLFPKYFNYEIQVIISPFSIDHSLDIRVVAILNASVALNCSQLPIDTPFAAASIGYIGGKFIFNPSYEELQKSDLEMFLVGNEKEISMIEVSANQLPESTIVEAISFGHAKIVKLIELQKQFFRSILIVKKGYALEALPEIKMIDSELKENFSTKIGDWINSVQDRKRDLMQLLEQEVVDYFQEKVPEEGTDWEKIVLTRFAKLVQEEIRQFTVENKKRIDQREYDQLRPLSCVIDYLPVVHGSAIFNRGETQTLSTVTLGAISSQKMIDDITLDSSSFFMHHYKAPPFSMGIAQKLRGISRREIGHGSLGEKALKRILPDVSDFPYTIRVASEVLASNGSTSQAAICSASLALMAAGVPIKEPVAGIALGLIKTNQEYHLLSDIQFWEDSCGDMDFKVAGTKEGICSLQLDLKIHGLPIHVIDKALLQGKVDRLKILTVMDKMIAVSRKQVSKNAMKFRKLQLAPDEVKIVIGSNGQTIKKIIADHNQPKIDIQSDGSVLIYHQNVHILDSIEDTILGLIKPVEVGEVFWGIVDNIMEYGAFVKLENKNVSGLIHISKLSDGYVDNVAKVLKKGQRVRVQVIDINQKKINLKLV